MLKCHAYRYKSGRKRESARGSGTHKPFNVAAGRKRLVYEEEPRGRDESDLRDRATLKDEVAHEPKVVEDEDGRVRHDHLEK